MLHGVTGTSKAEDGDDVYLQSFDVRFEYPVHFTRDLFDPENGTLADSITRLEPSLRHRVAVLIDNSVSAAMPILAHRIARYFGRHANRLELVSPPETVPGGEVVKNAPALVDRLQPRLLDWRVDRHCAIVAIGGSAMLDMVGFVQGRRARMARPFPCFVAAILERHRARPISEHLEVETYTWDVLPERYRAGGVVDAITRELDWVVHQLAA
jgi:hypothetical protein